MGSKIHYLLVLLLGVVVLFQVFQFRLYKLILGEARLIKEQTGVRMKGDGVDLATSAFYPYSDEGGRKAVVYLTDHKAYKKRHVILIDLDKGKVGSPNSSIRDYSKWGNFLFQNASGNWFIPFDNKIKGLDFDPSLQVEKDSIIFDLPPNAGFPVERILIEL